MQVVESAGYYGMVYCSRDFFQRYTSLDELTGYDKWEAAYTSADTAAVANGIWQYSSRNALGIAGFGNSLDCDIAYKDYPGIIRAAGLNGLGAPAEEEPEAPEAPEAPEEGETEAPPRWCIMTGAMTAGDRDTVAELLASRGIEMAQIKVG